MRLVLVSSLRSIFVCCIVVASLLHTLGLFSSFHSPLSVLSSVHVIFACLAGVSFLPTYLGMLYFNLVKKCQPTAKLQVTLHTSTSSLPPALLPVDGNCHRRQLLPGTLIKKTNTSNGYAVQGILAGYKGLGVYFFRGEGQSLDKDLNVAHFSQLEIVEPRFHAANQGEKGDEPEDAVRESGEPGYMLRTVQAKRFPEAFREKLRRQGGVYIATHPTTLSFEPVSFNPSNQLVHLQVKVAVAALASFFGKADDWKWLLLLFGLFAVNILTLLAARRSPLTNNRRVNVFHMTCISVCIMTNTVEHGFACQLTLVTCLALLVSLLRLTLLLFLPSLFRFA